MTDSVPVEIAIRKLLDDGTPSYVWHGQIVERHPDSLVVEAYYHRDFRDLGYVIFERHDLFVEFYYLNRWYNVLQVYSDGGELRGWYCNITRPAELVGSDLIFTDLALDLFVYPDGRYLPLDVEEFEEKAASIYTPDEVTAGRAAFQELQHLAETHSMPSRPFHPRTPESRVPSPESRASRLTPDSGPVTGNS